MSYFDKQNNQKVNLTEITFEDVSFIEDDQQYLFKYGSSLIHSSIMFHDNKYVFFTDSKFIPIEKALQIWKINPING